MNAQIKVKHLRPTWERSQAATDIAPIRDETHYRRMVSMLEALLDEVAEDESHLAMGLVDVVGDLIEDYEAEQHPLPSVTGVQALRFLMMEHGLRQGDLPEIGSQGVLSEFLLASANSTYVRFGLSVNALPSRQRPLSESRVGGG